MWLYMIWFTTVFKGRTKYNNKAEGLLDIQSFELIIIEKF